jgi:hypothetical protein
MWLLVYADVENLVKQWLATTSVAPLVTRTVDSGLSIFLAMPPSAPLPAVVLYRVAGAPSPGKDLPEEATRLSFDCWGRSRAEAGAIARALMAELETLARVGGYDSGDARLAAAEVINVVWLPDPESDTPRYVVDATVTTVT